MGGVYDHRMLHLHSETSARWLQQVDESLELVLIDHAHCERKAASTAMSLLASYVENERLCRAMTTIVEEELDHFRRVRNLLRSRGIPFRRIKPSSYGRRLHEMIRRQEPQRATDRLLVASLIEARSCERFAKLRAHLQDPQLSDFYGDLFASEARHHTTYVELAGDFAAREEVAQRLDQLAAEEARIIARGDPFARMHS